MTYTITPYKRDGGGSSNKISTSGSSTTTNCNTARGFRNVAVGATLYANALERTVSSKTDEDTVIVNSAWDLSAGYVWEYQNPALTLSGIYYIKHTKDDRPLTSMGMPTKDADYTFCTIGKGVIREIVVSGFIQSATIADVYTNVTILESLADGSQTYQGTCTFTEDVPPRTSYIYITSASWQYNRDKPTWLDIMINMTECRNRGST
jgi:hypothetical protein